ncbi:leucyl aminopeptidase family protein, partial [bacterium]|nr:leucyl aminopeptidase family protein [bacterium]
ATLLVSEDEKKLSKLLNNWTSFQWREQTKDKKTSAQKSEAPKSLGLEVQYGELGPICALQLETSKPDFRWPTLDQGTLWGETLSKVGEALRALDHYHIENLEIHLESKSEEMLSATVCALEMFAYTYLKKERSFKKVGLLFNGKPVALKQIQESIDLGLSTNWARHLVNLPPNELNPVTYAKLVKDLFLEIPSVKVEVWDEKRLEKEGCGLHLAVGKGSDRPPRLVQLKYRPKKTLAQSGVVALVGKGITFDSGGLDIKPSSGMRLMKKDMGGSAAVVGAFLYAVKAGLPIKLDAYLALAENSVSERSFRPSDVVTARNGKQIEIHNTDAEGRLVLADALDVAVTQKEKPEVVVDVATLTGAIKVALGAKVAGLFSNDSQLSQSLFKCFEERGDDAWPMPLYQKYRSQMNSSFANMTNAVDGFGGAVTAALFLESFVKDLPWAHLDIYAWKDSAEGPISEPGGSGQAVMGLANWLKSKSQMKS